MPRDMLPITIATKARTLALRGLRDAHEGEYQRLYRAHRADLEAEYGYKVDRGAGQRREAAERIEDYLQTHPDSTLKEIADGMGVKWRWVVKWIRILNMEGKLKSRWVVENRAQAKRWSLS